MSLEDNALLSLQEIKDYLNYVDAGLNDFFETLINNASDFLDRHCHRNLKEMTHTLERYDGEGDKLILNNYPISAIVQICNGKLDVIKVKYTSSTAYNAYVRISITGVDLIVDGTPLGSELTFVANATLSAMATIINAESGWEASVLNSDFDGYPSSQLFRKENRFALNQFIYLEIPGEPLDGYDVDYSNGIIYLPSEFSQGFRNIFVSSIAGFSTVPGALKQICIELVKMKYEQRKKDPAMKSEKIGSVYQYTVQDLKDGLPPDLIAQLDLFIKREF